MHLNTHTFTHMYICKNVHIYFYSHVQTYAITCVHSLLLIFFRICAEYNTICGKSFFFSGVLIAFLRSSQSSPLVLRALGRNPYFLRVLGCTLIFRALGRRPDFLRVLGCTLPKDHRTSGRSSPSGVCGVGPAPGSCMEPEREYFLTKPCKSIKIGKL